MFGYTLADAQPAPDGVQTSFGDIRDADRLGTTIESARPDVVFHLAAVAAVGAAWSKRRDVLEINALGTSACLQAVASTHKTARVVLVSSGEVYGHVAPADMPVGEDHPFRPGNPYAASKACAEIIASEFTTSHALDVVTVRPFNFAGPGQELGFVCSDFAHQVALAETGAEEARLQVGNLSAERDFTDVRDLVAGLLAAANAGTAGDAYNLCTGRPIAIQAIVDHFVDAARRPIQVEYDPERSRPSDVPTFIGDPACANRVLGWTPSIPFSQTLDDTLHWWRSRVEAGSC